MKNSRLLLRFAACALAASALAGCSSGSMRMGSLDEIFTGATPNQRAMLDAPKAQPYPGGQQTAAAEPLAPAPASQPIQRGTLSPVASAQPQYQAQYQPPAAPAPAYMPPAQPQVASAQPAPVRAAPRAASGGSTEVVVSSGDTLNGLARRHGVSPSAIMRANNMSDPNAIQIGRTIVIPAAGQSGGATGTAVAAAPAPKPRQKPAEPAQKAAEVPVKPTTTTAPARVDATNTASTGPSQAKTEAKPAAGSEKPTVASYTPPAKSATKAMSEAMDADDEAPGATGIGKMRWPARGRVISKYGSGTDGIDIAVPEGTPVKAAENGVVIYAGDGLKEFGNTVLVRHENGLVTVYGHASEIKVQRGATVKRGQEIATSGMTGKTDTPKLHFEVRKDSAPVDPSTYLE